MNSLIKLFFWIYKIQLRAQKELTELTPTRFIDELQQHLRIRMKQIFIKFYNCCLFERLFKVKKNDIFLFAISFFILEIFTFLHYANEESDDIIGCSIKTEQHSIKNISRSMKSSVL